MEGVSFNVILQILYDIIGEFYLNIQYFDLFIMFVAFVSYK